ncbi:MAG: hypothetical protein MUF48_21500 [Pirellulaceae bacterium]|nr:hypothetical protein [Pirellulaceae bacterium]
MFEFRINQFLQADTFVRASVACGLAFVNAVDESRVWGRTPGAGDEHCVAGDEHWVAGDERSEPPAAPGG